MMLFLKKRVWLTLVLFLTLILIFRAIPAGWLVFFIQQSTPGLKVQGVSGTLWQGEIANSMLQERGGALPLGNINWSLSPLSLFTLNPCANLTARADAQNISGKACYGLFSGKVALEDVSLSLPLANISPLLEVDIRGNIDGQITKLLWNGEIFNDADARLLWRGAQINNGSQWIALGNITARSNATEEGNLSARWATAPTDGDGPQLLNVQLTTLLSDLATQGKVKVDGTIGLTNQTRVLRPMLQFIGDEVSSNTFRVNMNEPL